MRISVLATLLLAVLATGCSKGGAPKAAEPAALPGDTATSANQAPVGAEEAAKQSLRELIEHCRAGDHARAAGHLLYNGSDESRRMKGSMSFDTPGESAAVEAQCGHIAGMVEQSGGFAIVGYSTEEEGEGLWHRVVVSVSAEGEPTRRTFSLLEVDGKYLMGNLD